MTNSLLWVIIIVASVNVILVAMALIRFSRNYDDAGKALREELRSGREDANKAARELREEVTGGLKSSNDTLSATLKNMGDLQRNQLDGMIRRINELTEGNQKSLDGVRDVINSRVKELQDSNEKKLEEMRNTVDEKLHDTLEKRLGESFKLVSERLEAVQRGLGEMQNLATGVGDLKRVLTNVKLRGTWAEIQLGALLEQMLAPSQYAKNVHTKPDSREVVEYAIRLPGPKDDPSACVWLPIDSKFLREDYLRIQEAAERGDPDGVQKASETLARAIKSLAQDIHNKYINPPHTTDFAIMFLATEGLYAEVIRQPALVEEIQLQSRVVVAGPTTLAAILSSLRMGFQTLAIEQRAAEVWRVLSAVKTEFSKFGNVLDKVKKQLNTATNTIVQTGVRTRAMERKLQLVEKIPEDEASQILELPQSFGNTESEDIEDKLDDVEQI